MEAVAVFEPHVAGEEVGDAVTIDVNGGHAFGVGKIGTATFTCGSGKDLVAGHGPEWRGSAGMGARKMAFGALVPKGELGLPMPRKSATA